MSAAHDVHAHGHHDDDEHEGHGGRDGGRTERPAAGGLPAPTAPVPDNGLFQGKARPKVEVN